MTTVSDYCKNNQDFQQLLEVFSKGYIPVYNKRRVAARNEIKDFMNQNFNMWYISQEYCPPARLINSHIYHKFGSDVVVYPVCKPVFKKDKLMDINYSFRVFTLDDHPVIKDIQLFLQVTRDMPVEVLQGDEDESITMRIINFFADTGNISELTFSGLQYVATLADICKLLSLTTILENDGKPNIVYNEENITAFFALPGQDKLKQVINVLIERFVHCYDKMALPDKRPDMATVEAMLQECQDLGDLMVGLFGDIFEQFEEFLANCQDADIDLDSIEEIKAKGIIVAEDIIIMACFYFFLPFAQYLQLIQPQYDEDFIFTKTDDAFLKALKTRPDHVDEEKFRGHAGAVLYYLPPEGYTLTALGAGLCNKDLSQVDHIWYPLISPDEHQEVLAELLGEDIDVEMDGWPADIVNNFLNADDIIAAIADLMQRNIENMKSVEETGPLAGLNPDGLPTFTDESATYIFKVKRQAIELKGTDTLAELSMQIQAIFDLDIERMSSFYMGTKFLDAKREIQCPRLWMFNVGEPPEAENYKICELNLYEKQKFLYLHDFIRENRFTITFAGIK